MVAPSAACCLAALPRWPPGFGRITPPSVWDRTARALLGLGEHCFRQKAELPFDPAGIQAPDERKQRLLEFRDEAMRNASRCVIGCLADIAIEDSLIEGLTRKLFSSLESDVLQRYHSPLGRLVLLSGDGRTHGGLCGILDELRDHLWIHLRKAEDRYDRAQTRLMAQADLFEMAINPTDQEITDFMDACEAISEALFTHSFLVKYMPEILNRMNLRLMRYCCNACEASVAVLFALRAALQADELRFLDTPAQKNASSFGDPRRDRTIPIDSGVLSEVLKRAAGDEQVQAFSKALTASLTGEQSREIWAGYAEAPARLMSEIRSLFRGVVKPLDGDLLSQLAALTFVGETAAKQILPDDEPFPLAGLGRIWGDPPRRQLLLEAAGHGIEKQLADRWMIRFSVQSPGSSRFPELPAAALMQETGELNTAVSSALKRGSVGGSLITSVLGGKSPSELFLAELIGPFPLALVSPIRDYAAAYFALRGASGVQLHPDRRWEETLPELYGDEAEDWFFRVHGVPKLAKP